MDTQDGFLLLATCSGGDAATQAGRAEQGQQIGVESASDQIHSGATQTEQLPVVKTDMGQQSNKIQKRRRREAYLKRKKATRKVKAAAKK